MPSHTLSDFLDYYEAAHKSPANRYMHHAAHVVGPVGGMLLVWSPSLGLSLVAVSFLMSWSGHYLFERNTPAFFDAAEREGTRGAVSQKTRVALGGILWSGACLLRLVDRGPMATDRLPTVVPDPPVQ